MWGLVIRVVLGHGDRAGGGKREGVGGGAELTTSLRLAGK